MNCKSKEKVDRERKNGIEQELVYILRAREKKEGRRKTEKGTDMCKEQG